MAEQIKGRRLELRASLRSLLAALVDWFVCLFDKFIPSPSEPMQPLEDINSTIWKAYEIMQKNS
jgi:hypothetical protein